MEILKSQNTNKEIKTLTKHCKHSKVYRYYNVNADFHKDFKKPNHKDMYVFDKNTGQEWFIGRFSQPEIVYKFSDKDVAKYNKAQQKLENKKNNRAKDSIKKLNKHYSKKDLLNATLFDLSSAKSQFNSDSNDNSARYDINKSLDDGLKNVKALLAKK